jgi:drug/metabolite transporter (DMT)-like permease
MNPALWGGVSALGLGCADFMARFSGRAVGPVPAYAAVLSVGAVIFTFWVVVTGTPLVWPADKIWLLVLNGIATTVMSVLLYAGLARGPVSIVAPIVAAHPALVVLIAVVLGARPSAIQWAAMAVTVLGAVVIARQVERFERSDHADHAALRTTVLIACAACLAYAVLVSSGQAAVLHFGDIQTIWMSRLISLVAIAVLFAARRERPHVPRSWWPFLLIQGVLDAGGYLALFLGSHGTGAEIAAVTASTFGAVTTILARVVLKESIGPMQWFGIFMIFAGVAVLSASS